jgi:hypothetical protein
MSKRFVRNQKRKLREELAENERKLRLERHKLDVSMRRLSELDKLVADWDADVRRLLGDFSAFGN